jgi:phenylpyruvate tautomerase PptA (4-oxalocrotonate tautomerase family)
MPTLQLTVPKDDLDADEKAELIDRLTDTVSEFYQKEQDEDIRDFVNVQITETADTGYAVGGTIIG